MARIVQHSPAHDDQGHKKLVMWPAAAKILGDGQGFPRAPHREVGLAERRQGLAAPWRARHPPLGMAQGAPWMESAGNERGVGIQRQIGVGPGEGVREDRIGAFRISDILQHLRLGADKVGMEGSPREGGVHVRKGQVSIFRPHPDQLRQIGVARNAKGVSRQDRPISAFGFVESAKALQSPAPHQPGFRRIKPLRQGAGRRSFAFLQPVRVPQGRGEIMFRHAACRGNFGGFAENDNGLIQTARGLQGRPLDRQQGEGRGPPPECRLDLRHSLVGPPGLNQKIAQIGHGLRRGARAAQEGAKDRDRVIAAAECDEPLSLFKGRSCCRRAHPPRPSALTTHGGV